MYIFKIILLILFVAICVVIPISACILSSQISREEEQQEFARRLLERQRREDT